jgi:hypothetical protein
VHQPATSAVEAAVAARGGKPIAVAGISGLVRFEVAETEKRFAQRKEAADVRVWLAGTTGSGGRRRRGAGGAWAASVRDGGKEEKEKTKKKGGCEGCFRDLGAGEETFFSVAGGTEDEGISLCPAASRAVGGTYAVSNIACAVTEFVASDDSFAGWKLAVRCPAGEDADTNAVRAVCIS